MNHLIENVKQLRSHYKEIKADLPWLDASYWENEKASFEGFGRDMETDYVKSVDLELSLKGRLSSLRKKNIYLLRFNPTNARLDSLREIFSEMVENNIPLVILHTDIDIYEIIQLASANPMLKIIIESGPRKILYYIDEIIEALRQCGNLYLCNYNFCNWLGHEKLVNLGFGNRLLYGSHMPDYSSDVSMGPVIMSFLNWKTKCDIAGNNLRKILGLALKEPNEIRYSPVKEFIVDSHAHNLQIGELPIYKMRTPDQKFYPVDWIKYMDLCSVDQIYLIPGEVLYDSTICCCDYVSDLLKFRPERFFYYEIFNPTGDADHIKRLELSLKDIKCIGIKIHPTSHNTDADDDKYELVYRLAEKYRKPLLTHSWEISNNNPDQFRSHPDKFRRFLKKFGNLPFILGHAGGRPGAFKATIQLCLDFANVYVDLAGDYYNNGLVDILASRIGVEKILFASDVDWIDTRCNLAPVLASGLQDEDVLKILRLNALNLFKRHR